MGVGFFAQSEGAFLLSGNLLTESDPRKIRFETLPDGQIGLTAPPGGGRIAEEHSVVELSDGSLYTVYRSVDGWPVCSHSRDGGHTWEIPRYKTFRPGGRRMKNPRAANFVWKISGNRYLYWFHNHGGDFIRALGGHASLPNGLSPVYGRSPYDDRNPVWLCAGREIEGPHGKVLEWSQPEVVLYDDDPMVRISYPDLVEQNGRVWLTETDKASARVHEIPAGFLDDLFAQFETEPDGCMDQDNLIIHERGTPWDYPMPDLPRLLEQDYSSLTFHTRDNRAGITVQLVIEGVPDNGDPVFDSRDSEGTGILLRIIPGNRVEAVVADGRTVNSWTSDLGSLRPEQLNHVAFIVDGGPKLFLFVLNEELCDGAEYRQFGWGRYSPAMRTVNGTPKARVGGAVRAVAVLPRALSVSTCIRHQRSLAGTLKPVSGTFLTANP
jgi:hypothetical protein